MSDGSGRPNRFPSLGRYAVAFAVGLLVVVWTTAQLLVNTYASVTPDAGGVSTSPVFWLAVVALFLVGAAVSFVAAYRALYELLMAVRA